MKKYLLIITFLLIGIKVNASEFKFPDFSLTYKEVETEISKNYRYSIYNEKEHVYKIEDLYLQYLNQKVNYILLKKISETNYIYILALDNISTNEWVNTVLLTVYENGLMYYKPWEDTIIAGKYNKKYIISAVFMENTSKEEGTLKYISVERKEK